MAVDKKNYSEFLEKVADELDIPPRKYQEAVVHYKAVGKWLEDGEYPNTDGRPHIYPQGSFRLGTVVRPIRDSKDSEYDIDLVCELPIPKDATKPRSIKTMIGDRLRESPLYGGMLDDREGKRCWKLNYAVQDDLRFHLDVLPSIPDPIQLGDESIAITNKLQSGYEWSDSNPNGYAEWFDDQNQDSLDSVKTEQKKSIQALVPTVFESVDKVPDGLVRTPLRRAIQLLKRHRDVMFHDSPWSQYRPISIIITTLATHLYEDEKDVLSALTGIVTKLSAYATLIDGDSRDAGLTARNLIRRTADGWHLANPVNKNENFADRWQEDDDARAKAFFQWVPKLKSDLVDVLDEGQRDTVGRRLGAALGASVVSTHIGLIVPPPATAFSLSREDRAHPPKPWRHK